LEPGAFKRWVKLHIQPVHSPPTAACDLRRLWALTSSTSFTAL
jgi:hypothetical protein